jgi:hypothetical protein
MGKGVLLSFKLLEKKPMKRRFYPGARKKPVFGLLPPLSKANKMLISIDSSVTLTPCLREDHNKSQHNVYLSHTETVYHPSLQQVNETTSLLHGSFIHHWERNVEEKPSCIRQRQLHLLKSALCFHRYQWLAKLPTFVVLSPVILDTIQVWNSR